MINTKQKSRKDSGIIKKAETQHTIMENHHFTKEGRNREKIKKKMEMQNNQKTNNKMTVVSPSI